MTFQQWIEKLIAERFGTQTALATAIGLQLTPFTRGVQAGTFNVVNLLKLAKMTDTPPSDVLRMAGKADVADLIESLYGKSDLSASERKHVKQWKALSQHRRDILQDAIDELLGEPQAPTRRQEGRQRSAS